MLVLLMACNVYPRYYNLGGHTGLSQIWYSSETGSPRLERLQLMNLKEKKTVFASRPE